MTPPQAGQGLHVFCTDCNETQTELQRLTYQQSPSSRLLKVDFIKRDGSSSYRFDMITISSDYSTVDRQSRQQQEAAPEKKN
jgi:hypothetical protein